MNGCKITCYTDSDECQYLANGRCGLYDRACEEIHVNTIREDGEDGL